MTEGGSFYGTPTARGWRRDRLAAVVVILVVVGIALAIAKPWGDAGAPAPSLDHGVAAASPSPAATPPASTASPSLPVYLPHPLPLAFTAPAPPASSAWRGLDWQRLASDDPLGAVRTAVDAPAASVAIGDLQESVSTTVWSSTDRIQWQPVASATATGFWPGTTIIGLTALGARFVAITEMVDYTTPYVPPVVSWTSANGREWTPDATLPVTSFASPTGSPPLVAAGPSGLVLATSGFDAQLATSPDGIHWVIKPRKSFPANFALVDLHGSASGYVAIGWMRKAHGGSAATLWSADGLHWPKSATVLPTPPSGSGKPGNAAVTLQVGDRGMIAVGIGGTPGAALWWQSSDGRHWRALPAFPPLGTTTCGGSNCGPQPKGTLVSDGHRLVALRGGSDGPAWVSTDGRHWTALRQTGDVPDAEATQATLLPGGVLLSDGIGTWYGQAVSR